VSGSSISAASVSPIGGPTWRLATLSLGWNYAGRVWDAEFFAASGVEPDSARIDYYRRLWQAEDGTADDDAAR
jgi:kanamycin kinase